MHPTPCYPFHSCLPVVLDARPAYDAAVGFSDSIPLLTSSSGAGRLLSAFSRWSAFMLRSSSIWWACRAGAALESGRMWPVLEQLRQRLLFDPADNCSGARLEGVALKRLSRGIRP